MTIPTLGTLVEAHLRTAWPNEAHSFTPWLAEHLDTLAVAVGIPLELEGREVAVETFSADILARNTLDDSLVLIENQLEVTDHSHLGQIMTYLAGLGAHTVIWLAADFREAHLSALRWLNDHTVDPFAFFAVKVKVVRIGDSPLAPIFEVVVRPNQWERRLQIVAQEARSLTEIGQFRKAFWEHYVNRYPDGQKRAAAMSNRWYPIPGTNLVVSIYIARSEAGIFVRGQFGAQNTDVYASLTPHAERIARLTGASLGTPDRDHFFVRTYPADTADRATWDALADWLYKMTNLYANTLQEMGETDGPQV